MTWNMEYEESQSVECEVSHGPEWTDEILQRHVDRLAQGLPVAPLLLGGFCARCDEIPDISHIVIPKHLRQPNNIPVDATFRTGFRQKPGRGRGRASQLRERARQIRERGVADNLSGTGSDFDALSSISSMTRTSSHIPSSPGAETHQVPLQTQPTPKRQSPFTPAYLQDRGFSHSPSEESTREPGQFEDAEPGKILPGNDQNKKKSKRTKFTKLDLAEPYEEYEAELLYGTPAGAEGTGFTGLILPEPNYEIWENKNYGSIVQKQPKTQSVLDFPYLPNEPKNTSPTFHGLPKKPEKNSMKSIASFVVDNSEDKLEAPSSSKEDDCKEESGWVVVVMENVPAGFTKETLRDFVQDCGQVTHVRTERVGHGFTAYVSMTDLDTATWVADILDDSDAFLVGGEGKRLSVYLQGA